MGSFLYFLISKRLISAISNVHFAQISSFQLTIFNILLTIKYIKVLDEGRENGLYGVKFNFRGEPTLHKSLSKFVRYAVDAGLVDVYFNTNASRLDEKKSVEMIESGPYKNNLFF